MFATCESHSAAVAFLIENGADINKFENRFDRTALILASQYGHAAVVDILIAKEADLKSH
jgi:ankyrin repeat protein